MMAFTQNHSTLFPICIFFCNSSSLFNFSLRNFKEYFHTRNVSKTQITLYLGESEGKSEETEINTNKFTYKNNPLNQNDDVKTS